MNRRLLILVCASLFTVAYSHADPKSRKDTAHPVEAAAPRQVFNYEGDDILVVLRTLARQAKMNLIIEDGISGTINMRIDDKTPREAIEIICDFKGLILNEKRGIFFARLKNPLPKVEPKGGDSSFEDALAEKLSPVLAKIYDSALDYLLRPETAQKLAKIKKQYYDALIAEGFTKDEAFRIILTNQELPFPGGSK